MIRIGVDALGYKIENIRPNLSTKINHLRKHSNRCAHILRCATNVL
jgi:hypothetical protein